MEALTIRAGAEPGVLYEYLIILINLINLIKHPSGALIIRMIKIIKMITISEGER